MNYSQSLFFQIDNKMLLSYLLKIGVTANQSMFKLSKDVWDILLSKNIAICRIPTKCSKPGSELGVQKPQGLFFQKLVSQWGHPTVDLFASRLCHQIKNYIAWGPDPYSMGVDALQQR